MVGSSLKKEADETLFLELALRGYDLSKLRDEQTTAEIIKIGAFSGAPLLYLPPYSPDLNPIEHDFANIKRCWEYNNQQPLEDIIKMYK